MNWEAELRATAPEVDAREITGTGADLLDDVEGFLSRFVAYPSKHERIAHVLWLAHVHAMDEPRGLRAHPL